MSALAQEFSEQGRRLPRWLIGDRGIAAPLLFLAPFLIAFSVFLLYPIGYGLYVSFTDWDLMTSPKRVGFENYRNLLDNGLFWKSLRNTTLFVCLNVPLVVLIPLGLAILVNEPIAGRTFFRSAFTAPVMISVSSVGIVWVWFYNPALGLINYYLDSLGLPTQNWLNQSGWSMVAVVITTVWWTTGFNLILFLAGLQEIPDHLYEAAKLDGAGAWSLFKDITIPGLKHTILFVTVTTMIGSRRVFGQVFVITNGSGGPFDSTRTIVQHLYEEGFKFFRMGDASAVAWILFIIVVGFTLLQFRLLRADD